MPEDQPTRVDLVLAAVENRRTGGYTYLNDEGNPKSPTRPQDIPEDAVAVFAPGPRVIRASQYLRRLRRLANRAKDC